MLLFGWLGGDIGHGEAKVGRLITLEETGKIIDGCYVVSFGRLLH